MFLGDESICQAKDVFLSSPTNDGGKIFLHMRTVRVFWNRRTVFHESSIMGMAAFDDGTVWDVLVSNARYARNVV